METLLGIGIIIAIYIMCKAPERKFHNYVPPEGENIDYNAQSLDRVKNHLTNEQVMRNTINGKYNVKNK